MSNRTQSSGGIGFLGLLAIAFITLKLIGTITWPWWWVLSPLWAPFALVAVVLSVLLVAKLVVSLLPDKK